MGGRIYTCDGPGCEEAGSTLPISAGTGCFTEYHHSYRFCSYDCLAFWAAAQHQKLVIAKIVDEVRQ